eukprot:1161913-Pelagomonas_calceolata.AAC.4
MPGVKGQVLNRLAHCFLSVLMSTLDQHAPRSELKRLARRMQAEQKSREPHHRLTALTRHTIMSQGSRQIMIHITPRFLSDDSGAPSTSPGTYSCV